MSTDRPKAAAIVLAAVPTITSAATRLRVSSSMIMKISVSAAATAISRSYFFTVVHVLVGRGFPRDIHVVARAPCPALCPLGARLFRHVRHSGRVGLSVPAETPDLGCRGHLPSG